MNPSDPHSQQSPPTRGVVRRALIGVSDKSGIVEFARALADAGVEILSTGGTARALAEAGVPVRPVSDYTGFPEIMDGRVKTLHPRVHGGILSRRGSDAGVMREHGIEAIDLVAVNLYPFRSASASGDFDHAIENIDIGGPTLIRAAAKNHRHVTALVDSGDYETVLGQIRDTGGVSSQTRLNLAVKAFAHVSHYDSEIVKYLDRHTEAPCDRLLLSYRLSRRLRYGENPHQSGALYADASGAGIAAAEQLHGKELSFNNIADADTAYRCACAFSEPVCVIVKHANPSSVALRADLLEAYREAYAGDPTSAFGGVIAFNRPATGALIRAILEQQFVEVIIAPDFDPGALEAVQSRKNVRLVRCEAAAEGSQHRSVSGGLLLQDADALDELDDDASLRCVTERAPTPEELRDLHFAWRCAAFVKSNAIVYAREQRTIGVGAGQMSRLYSARIASLKAEEEGLPVAGAVMASDAFFPFADGVEVAAEAGISAIIQPGGSIRDREVIAAADSAGMAMLFTGRRHFLH
ncbi:MAG: bifunctional phosphoribosylaminoimidazolecarboxamide formyltransferase/IMP cyclohydrolase [Gammaproteobacteria bacterium AqS3]|nr:bifunctional phosphoribosylaminoimidazolecarboxamide formyltransferase/IMP cyclohydrolase [Gammaproteobacteria bacterium AqS3]